MENDEVLKSLEVQRREEQKLILKSKQQSEMNARSINRDNVNAKLTNNAFGDKYITDAYAKVLESDITHNEDLLRMNGNWVRNQSIKNS